METSINCFMLSPGAMTASVHEYYTAINYTLWVMMCKWTQMVYEVKFMVKIWWYDVDNNVAPLLSLCQTVTISMFSGKQQLA